MRLIVHLRKIMRNNISEHLAASVFWAVQEDNKFCKTNKYMRDFRLSPRCRWDLLCSGILRSLRWRFHTDVSGQPIGPVFKAEDKADKLSQNVGTESPLYAA
jgi:hypothetical protein